MTVEESVRRRLAVRGFTENQVDSAIEYIKEHELMESMPDRWSDNVLHYSPQTMSTIWFSAMVIVDEWETANVNGSGG